MGEVIDLASRRPKEENSSHLPLQNENNHDEGEVVDIEKQVLTRLESLFAAYEGCRQNLRDTEQDIKRYSAFMQKNPEVITFVTQLTVEQEKLTKELGEMVHTLEALKNQAASTREKRVARA